MPMRWQDLPLDHIEEYGPEDLRALTKKAISTIKGHPVRIAKKNVIVPEYFGWFVDVIPNDKVILVFRKNKKDVELKIDNTMLVQILTIGLE
ncbi:MAG: hypothetical protein COX44_01260 [Candidatus Portnoybacteria bacterium CG23_combo_of_CG06-09_8_20_14_all_37_13]|uniref:Uncharacterized protein n=1 Tax=Candidatus Portnoybacteria bacterium CG23_combo_of_CG06-09_8_20_14_all_37_13 TaxID=1974819 RepID=A0A2G9YDD1_9BACT|nr:MAG: hypothetical protein COX44_01260 [Candidatus Portnoybacteria bacterium CG23_combo_of_CG06-09_8_20_14_all_37_13]